MRKPQQKNVAGSGALTKRSRNSMRVRRRCYLIRLSLYCMFVVNGRGGRKLLLSTNFGRGCEIGDHEEALRCSILTLCLLICPHLNVSIFSKLILGEG